MLKPLTLTLLALFTIAQVALADETPAAVAVEPNAPVNAHVDSVPTTAAAPMNQDAPVVQKAKKKKKKKSSSKKKKGKKGKKKASSKKKKRHTAQKKSLQHSHRLVQSTLPASLAKTSALQPRSL